MTAPTCRWCGLFRVRDGKPHCLDTRCSALADAHRVGVGDERAAVRQLCLDEASREGTKAKAAKKKGHVDDAVIARCSADAFRKIARLLAPPKPKKARKVTT